MRWASFAAGHRIPCPPDPQYPARALHAGRPPHCQWSLGEACETTIRKVHSVMNAGRQTGRSVSDFRLTATESELRWVTFNRAHIRRAGARARRKPWRQLVWAEFRSPEGFITEPARHRESRLQIVAGAGRGWGRACAVVYRVSERDECYVAASRNFEVFVVL